MASESHSEHLSDAAFRSSAAALEHLTEEAATEQGADPKTNLHRPSDAASSHSWLARHVPTSTIEHWENKFHLGNYVKDRATGDKSFETMSIYVRLGMHLLYYGSAQEKLLHSEKVKELLERESRKMGAQYDAPESKAHIRPFMDSFGLEATMKEMVEPDPDAYPNFNAFFAREIRPDARPPAEPDNQNVTSSPADCRLTAFPTIDLATEYWIKGFGFTLARLLGSDDLAARFEGGSLAIARLAPQDYHRWHSPVNGIVESVTEIPGAYYTVNPQAINEAGTMDVFCENRRSVMILRRTPQESPVAVVAVGAMLVGSIRYVDGVGIGSQVKRGQCLGAFYYGGSTVIVVYPKGEVKFDEDLVKTSIDDDCETLVKVGDRIGEKPAV